MATAESPCSIKKTSNQKPKKYWHKYWFFLSRYSSLQNYKLMQIQLACVFKLAWVCARADDGGTKLLVINQALECVRVCDGQTGRCQTLITSTICLSESSASKPEGSLLKKKQKNKTIQLQRSDIVSLFRPHETCGSAIKNKFLKRADREQRKCEHFCASLIWALVPFDLKCQR